MNELKLTWQLKLQMIHFFLSARKDFKAMALHILKSAKEYLPIILRLSGRLFYYA